MSLADVVLAKKWELDALRQPVPPDALARLETDQRIGVIYASNAMDGNTLSAGQTALIVEQGMTFTGHPLKDHLEVAEYTQALNWAVSVAADANTRFGEVELRRLHRLVVGQSNPEISGRYTDRSRRIEAQTGTFDFPDPDAVPALTANLLGWLDTAPVEPATAFEAHFRLLAIHPFSDGNGRTARLLGNLLLARAGFPLIAVRPEDKGTYDDALVTALRAHDSAPFCNFLFQRLDRTLDIYLAAARQARPASVEPLVSGEPAAAATAQ